MRVSVVADEHDADPGFVGEHLAALGAQLQLLPREDLRGGAASIAQSDLLVLLGSDRSVHDETARPVVTAEQQLVREAQRRGLPVLAICYGAQLVAQLLGERVAPAPVPEVGWTLIESAAPALIEAGPWFELHYDRFSAPQGLPLLAKSAAAPQAFSFGRTLAVQFHPEVTPTMVRTWLAADADRLGPLAVDLEALLAESSAREGEARVRCGRLVDCFLKEIANRPLNPFP